MADVKRLEDQRAAALAQLEHLDGLARAAVTWGDDLRGEIHARLTDGQALIGLQPAAARQILRKLLVGRLVMTPHRGRGEYGLNSGEVVVRSISNDLHMEDTASANI